MKNVLPQDAAKRFVLRLLKGMYGLNDAPQLWQLSLRYHLQIEMKATPSHHDDCFFSWRDPETGRCTGVATAHVDDTNNSAPQHLLDSRRAILEKRFGALTVAKTPCVHVGITVERMSDGGYRLHQAGLAKAIKLLEVKRGRPAEEPLSPAEVALLGGALHLRELICVPNLETALGDAVQRDQAFAAVQLVMSVGAVDRACHEPLHFFEGARIYFYA